MSHENSVGSMQCKCGETMDVRQSRKRGHYLYTVCPECGMDQRTGAPVQNAIWHGATFTGEVLRPSNVSDDWKPKASEPVGEPVTEKPSEIEQTSLDVTLEEITQEATESVALEQKPGKKGGVRQFVGCLLVIVGFVGVVWQTV